MILVTGGLGFIGSHTVQALLDLGERCVLLQRRPAQLPPYLDGASVVVEQGDVTDAASLAALGDRHEITAVVHLAGSMPWPPDPADPIGQTRRALGGLLNVMESAQRWGVRRVGVASTIGVYAGVDAEGGLSEDLPLPTTSPHLIPTFKKIGEQLNGYLCSATGLDIIDLRVSGTWGPRGHDDPFFPAPYLARAAAHGTAPDLSGLRAPARADDALDLCYVKDTGRAIALLMLAGTLQHRTYNVGSGRSTSNADVIAALRGVVPEFAFELPDGGGGPGVWLDISRLHEDTGYKPAYDVDRAAADYVAWLRAGNPV
ncbi:NAD-dependent epimerase/dehydratase family protein [Spongisporangium articulatum]|uniref:NAD-dependent epimerase/dehydratase family protein n=1 Tax=Spongisporangium articulatum TaxID=3362603 RepID=A0ABW8AWE0_9ACTN